MTRPMSVGLTAAVSATVSAAVFLATPALAQVPAVVPYQGYLTQDGEAVDDTLTMTFRLYASPDGPDVVWQEERPVEVVDGAFYVYLGMFQAIAGALEGGQGRYLGVSIEGEGEASPRQALGSVPYALHAASARDAELLGGYAADDFATEDWVFQYVRGLGYATEAWVRQQNYLSGDVLDGYASEEWVREQGYATEEWIGEQGYADAEALADYASEQWVRDQGYASEAWVGEQGYLSAGALDGYASEQWVRDQGYLGADALAGAVEGLLDGYASEQWVRDQGYVSAAALEDYASEQWVRDQGYLGADALDGYASEQWVRDQGYASEAWVAEQGYLGADALAGALDGLLDGYASEQWVRDQGYLTGDALNGYVTTAALDARGYVSGDALDARGYLTAGDLGGYVTTAALDARGYVSGDALDARGYLTGDDLDARGYLTADDLDGYVTTAALDARGYVTEADLGDYASAADLAALAAEVASLRDRLGGPYVLGRSNQTSGGRFTFGGQNGAAAAHAMCQASYPGEASAHLCTPGEVMQAISTGRYNAQGVIDDVATWTIADNAYGVARGNGSLHNTCQNLLYNSADASSGTRLTVDLNYQSQGGGGGVTGRLVRIDQDIACNTSMPVLCCR